MKVKLIGRKEKRRRMRLEMEKKGNEVGKKEWK